MLSEYSGRGYQKNPLTLNLYTYCANNPIKYYDPSCHFRETVLDVGGIIWCAADMWKACHSQTLAFFYGTTEL